MPAHHFQKQYSKHLFASINSRKQILSYLPIHLFPNILRLLLIEEGYNWFHLHRSLSSICQNATFFLFADGDEFSGSTEDLTILIFHVVIFVTENITWTVLILSRDRTETLYTWACNNALFWKIKIILTNNRQIQILIILNVWNNGFPKMRHYNCAVKCVFHVLYFDVIIKKNQFIIFVIDLLITVKK